MVRAATEVGLSRGHLQRLLRRYREGGLEALEPRSRRPRTNPGRTPEAVCERIVTLRTELTAQGLDAGPVTIAWHLEREVTVVDLGTGEVLSSHLIEPDRGYWRNQRRNSGRWPGFRATE